MAIKRDLTGILPDRSLPRGAAYQRVITISDDFDLSGVTGLVVEMRFFPTGSATGPVWRTNSAAETDTIIIDGQTLTIDIAPTEPSLDYSLLTLGAIAANGSTDYGIDLLDSAGVVRLRLQGVLVWTASGGSLTPGSTSASDAITINVGDGDTITIDVTVSDGAGGGGGGTPDAHAASHAAAGGDPISPASIGAATAAQGAAGEAAKAKTDLITVTSPVDLDNPTPLNDLADTWNDSGTTFDAIRMNVTDTASNAASLLLNLLVGDVSKASISKDGYIAAARLSLDPESHWLSTGTTLLRGAFYGATRYEFNYFNLTVDPGMGIGWGATAAVDSPDTYITRHAAGVVQVNTVLRIPPTTLASQPTAATVGNGAVCSITDGATTTLGAVATGSGSLKQSLISDGTDWRVLSTPV